MKIDKWYISNKWDNQASQRPHTSAFGYANERTRDRETTYEQIKVHMDMDIVCFVADVLSPCID
jgi:hypothetical protein